MWLKKKIKTINTLICNIENYGEKADGKLCS